MTINDPRDNPEYQVGGNKYQAPVEMQAKAGTVDPLTVAKFHEKSDVDSSQDAQHHSLGPRHDQAAAGDHTHLLGSGYTGTLKGVVITGAKNGNVALASVIAALVKLGATDSTTA